jgi:SAM-dependent methyltransferase
MKITGVGRRLLGILNPFKRGFAMATQDVLTDGKPVESPTVADAVATTSEEQIVTEEKKDEKPKLKPSFQRSWYASNPDYLQASHMTKPERFPLIFDSAKKLQPDAKRILSFGCSTGEECQALAKRFPDSEIVGLDIDHYTIQRARRSNKSDKIFFTDEIGCTGKYDLVTALMVFFCMEEPIPKDRFVSCLKKIDRHLNDGGVLMIYTADYDPKEVLGDNYEDLNVWMREHNKNKKQYWNGYYRKKGGTITYELKLDVDPATMPSND